VIVIIPIGNPEEAVLEGLEQSLPALFGQRVKINDRISPPSELWNQDRAQYLAPSLLDLVPHPSPGNRALGVVEADIYVPGLNFVFGLADVAGKRALISLRRLGQGFYGLPADDALLLDRAVKEAVHELGHTYGLTHCPDRTCVMHFSNSLRDTDLKGSDFCPTCRGKLIRITGAAQGLPENAISGEHDVCP